MDKLINSYQYELVEDHHSPGSGRYSVRVTVTDDISPAFPYLNAEFDDTVYDHENQVFIGKVNSKRYAFRPHEIRIAAAADPSNSAQLSSEIVDLVNQVWARRDSITPSIRERKLPTVYDVYKLLPGTNCKQCGCLTCLAFAARLLKSEVSLDDCPLLSQEKYANNRKQIAALFSE